ncbi:MAG: S9 family peptidase [Saprospiraceae bacterium]
MMRKRFTFLLLFLFSIANLTAQKAITVENIWRDYSFFGQSVPGFNFQNDGKHYTRQVETEVKQYDLLTGAETEVIFDASAITNQDLFKGKFDGYQFSSDEKRMLIKSETEAIYRRSTRAKFFVWDRASETLTDVDGENKVRYASFSDQADKVAFVKANNLYYKDLGTGKIKQITKDGKSNAIINGATDWVYEEEFAMSKAFEWSPDGNKIAFMRFDESKVKEFSMTMYYDEAYPAYSKFKYPKVGEDNAVVTVHIYDLNTAKITKVETGAEKDKYFPRIKWIDAKTLCAFRMNRHQNDLELLRVDANNGKTSLLLQEKNKYYIDIHDNLTFLKDGKHFIWTSEQDGYNHIYLYDMKGEMKKQITSGKFDVTNFYGYDADRKIIFYQAAEDSPLERAIYSINLKGKKKKKLTPRKGTNNVQFSSTYDYYVTTHSDVNTPNSYTVYNLKGKEIRVIEDNAAVKAMQTEYGVAPVEFFNFKTSEAVALNGYMIKPVDFDATKKYPVFMYVYGGPGSQTVNDRFIGANYWWFQMLAQQGYIVVSVDNRGTGARGEEFKKMTYLELGKYETMDQIEAAKYLASLPYVEGSRIGIFGWSYGGYMSSLCLSKGADVFKAAIAVAPVTNWKWYDSIYTERYMRTYKENKQGYESNSPVYFADKIKGSYLLVHGIGDDNVHFQNAAEMFNALVKANVQFDSYFYPNRNHGIYGGNTRLHLYTKMTNFIKANL